MVLPDDMIFHMMEFCDYDQLSTIMMVSLQWYKQSLSFSFDKTIRLWSNTSKNDAINQMKELCNHPSSLLITKLDLTVKLTSDIVNLLSESVYLTRLKSLTIVHIGASIGRTLDTLFGSDILHNLTFLKLENLGMDDKGFELLSKSTHQLSQLILYGNNQTYMIANYMAQSEHFKKLTSLDCDWKDDHCNKACQYLCKSENISQLKHITFRNINGNGDGILESLANSNSIKLETLYFYGKYKITPISLSNFLSSKNSSHVSKLGFDSTSMDDGSIQVIAQSPHSINLRELSIPDSISDQGGRYLLESPYLHNLQSLSHLPDRRYYGERMSATMKKKLRKAFSK